MTGPLQPNPVAPLLNLNDSVIISGQNISLSPADYAAAFPRTNGTITLTLTGTVTNNDSVTVNFAANFLPGQLVSLNVAIANGDTLASIAQKLATAINENATLRNFGVTADSALAVVTVNWPGPLASTVTVTITVGGAHSEAITLAPVSGVPTGGSGYILPYQDFNYAFQGNVMQFRVNHPVVVDADLVAALVNDGMPIT